MIKLAKIKQESVSLQDDLPPHHSSYFQPLFNFSDSSPSSREGDQNSLPPFKKGD